MTENTDLRENARKLIDESVVFLLSGVANRLGRFASSFYRTHFGVGVQEWRLLLVLGDVKELTIGDAAIAADLDTGAASRALKALNENGLVTLRVTSSRGRATLAALTPEGFALHQELRAISAKRVSHITAGLSADDLAQLRGLLETILANTDQMNAAWPENKTEADNTPE